MTDLKPFFEADERFHFTPNETALYIKLIGLIHYQTMPPHGTVCIGDLDLRHRLRICKGALSNARLRLKEAGLIGFTLGKSNAKKTEYFIQTMPPHGTVSIKKQKKYLNSNIYNNNILLSNSNINNNTNYNTNTNNNILISKKEKINNKKEKKQVLEIETEPLTHIPQIIQINNPQPLEIEKLIDNTTEPIKTQPKRTKSIKQTFTPPTRDDIQAIAKKHWQETFSKERRLEWAEVTGTPSTATQVDAFYEYWAASEWRNNKKELITNPARNWATWINLELKKPKQNGKSQRNGGNNTASTNKHTILASRYAEICEYLSRNDRETAVAIWGEGDVRKVEERAVIHT